MQKREKLGIAIVVILTIIWVITVWNSANPKVNINCKTACYRIGNAGWIFPGAGPIGRNISYTKEDCISACQDRFQK